MPYLPPFDVIRRSVQITKVQGELRVSLSYDDFVKLLKTFLAAIEVDEAWYMRHYEDIARAANDGGVSTATRHFVEHGYFEGRMPFPIQVDEAYYLRTNPDVADSIRSGLLESAQQHFTDDGYKEGRLPFPA